MSSILIESAFEKVIILTAEIIELHMYFVPVHRVHQLII